MPVYRLIYTITVQIKVSYYHCPIDPSILHIHTHTHTHTQTHTYNTHTQHTHNEREGGWEGGREGGSNQWHHSYTTTCTCPGLTVSDLDPVLCGGRGCPHLLWIILKFHYTFVVCNLFILSVADTREGMYLHGYLHGTHNNSQIHTCIQRN